MNAPGTVSAAPASELPPGKLPECLAGEWAALVDHEPIVRYHGF